MPDPQDDLFNSDMPGDAGGGDLADITGTDGGRTAAPDLKTKVQALIDAHFPPLHAAGQEAHQPLREFLLDLAALLP